jgi:small subunit ribosomal protein S18
MARNNDRDRGKRTTKDTRPRGKKKVCIFCKDHMAWVDYKDVNLLRRFMSDRGKIRARRVSGNCAQHQRDVATAIKTARELALLPYTQRTVSERGPGRGGGGSGRSSGPREPAAETGAILDIEAIEETALDGGTEIASAVEVEA